MEAEIYWSKDDYETAEIYTGTTSDIWARKMQKVPHKFNYGLMKKLNDGKQMTDVWRMPAIGRYFF